MSDIETSIIVSSVVGSCIGLAAAPWLIRRIIEGPRKGLKERLMDTLGERIYAKVVAGRINNGELVSDHLRKAALPAVFYGPCYNDVADKLEAGLLHLLGEDELGGREPNLEAANLAREFGRLRLLLIKLSYTLKSDLWDEVDYMRDLRKELFVGDNLLFIDKFCKLLLAQEKLHHGVGVERDEGNASAKNDAEQV